MSYTNYVILILCIIFIFVHAKCVILYSLSTSLVLLCSLKTQDYVLVLSTFITEYDVLLLWLSPSLSLCLSLSVSLSFHAVRTSFKYGALYRHAHILTHHLSCINTCVYTMSQVYICCCFF